MELLKQAGPRSWKKQKDYDNEGRERVESSSDDSSKEFVPRDEEFDNGGYNSNDSD